MCHTVEATLDVLRTVFEDRIISRKADVVWPPPIILSSILEPTVFLPERPTEDRRIICLEAIS